MTFQLTKTNAASVKQTLRLLQQLFGGYHPRDFSVRLWEGTEWAPETGLIARFTLFLRHPGALRRMFSPPTELALSEAYIYGDFDIEGDIFAVFPLSDYVLDQHWGRARRLGLGLRLLSLPGTGGNHGTTRQAARLHGARHSIKRDRQAVRYHYDVSNDFYALWLDRRMVYSCAYLHHLDEDLDTAQERKLDYICRKLRLERGDRLLDIGCGWGGLIIFAAENYGVDATGITLSQPQATLAEERIREAGLSDRCRVWVRDYREANDPEGFDKLVSVGMFEHVGERLLPEYFSQAWRLLRPRGVFLNHGIGRSATYLPSRSPTFTNTHVFPEGELCPVNITVRGAEQAGFEVRDVENLREHYALTLRRWVSRLESRRQEALQAVDEATYRVWRLYMSGSAHGFETGRINIFQTLLAKPEDGKAELPLTRGDWYDGSGSQRE